MKARFDGLIAVLLAAMILAACGAKSDGKTGVSDKKGKESPAIPVIVATVAELVERSAMSRCRRPLR